MSEAEVPPVEGSQPGVFDERDANPEAWDREAYRRQLARAITAEAELERLRAENERLKASVANWERRFDAWQEWRLFEALGGSQAKGSE